MQVIVLLFASYADAVGSSRIELELGASASVRDVLDRVKELAGGRSLPPAVVAINQEYASPSDGISAGDEVAIIPPVAGG